MKLHTVCLLLCCWLLLVVTAKSAAAEVRELSLSQPAERAIAIGEKHRYQISLKKGQFLRLQFTQQGINLMMTVANLQQEVKIKLAGQEGIPLTYFTILDEDGRYPIEVFPIDAAGATNQSGKYQLKVETLREATSQDGAYIQANNIYIEAEELRSKRTKESLTQALAKYQEALPLWRTADNRQFEAITLNNIGLSYSQLEDDRPALDYYQRALTIFRAIGDQANEAAVLSNLGLIHYNLDQYSQAIDYYQQALKLNGEKDNPINRAITLHNLATAYHGLGEIQQSFDLINASLELVRQAGNRSLELAIMSSLAGSYLELRDTEQAGILIDQILVRAREMKDRRLEAQSLFQLGSIFSNQADYARGVEYYQQALAIRQELGERRSEAYCLHSLGLCYFNMGKYDQARESYQQALKIFEKLDRYYHGLTLNGLGLISYKLGKAGEAESYYRQGLAIIREIKYQRAQLAILYNLADLKFKQQDYPAARQFMEDLLAICESLRARVTNQELRTSFFTTVNDYYLFYIEILMALHRQQPADNYQELALQMSERARARSLIELLTEANANIRSGSEPALLAREQELQRQLNTSAAKLFQLTANKADATRTAKLEQEITLMTTELAELRNKIKAANPRYSNLLQPAPINFREIQSQLDDHTLLLEYAIGDFSSYVWAVTRTSIKSYRLPPRKEIETLAGQFNQSVQKTRRDMVLSPRDRIQAEQETARIARDLSQLILSPVSRELGNNRLLIVADGVLQYLPFAALPLPTANQQRTARRISVAIPLITRHEIVHVPSIAALMELRRESAQRQPAAKAIAVIADPVFEKLDERIERNSSEKPAAAATGYQNSQLLRLVRDLQISAASADVEGKDSNIEVVIPRLPSTRKEAEQITAFFEPEQYRIAADFQANRELIFSGELNQYRIIHFATHGFVDNKHPDLSGIILSLYNRDGSTRDGFLRAHEIFNINLSAELVVLSACQTGLGKDVRGEGLIGITRGFMYAGAARVMVSLWSVNDRATAALMTSFYKKMIKEGLRPAAALRAAQLEIMKIARWRKPYYWAGFQLQGEWQ